MALIDWEPNKEISQDPDARLDYYMDFTDYLAPNTDIGEVDPDVIIAATVTASANATVTLISFDDSTVQFWVSGVTETNTVTVHLTMQSAREDDFSFKFKKQER